MVVGGRGPSRPEFCKVFRVSGRGFPPQGRFRQGGAGRILKRTAILSRLPMPAMLAALAAWLWPIGVGGRMPVGGDVTQFQIGLMAVLRSAIHAGRLPLWNDLWGYGFPGVGESQMGVFYPPHWLLYGLLTIEAAYTASLVLHTAWGALGAAWASRKFGVSPWGSALSGFAFAACGFALIHLPHQWAYTCGSWMPWAWGLAWTLARGDGGWRSAWALAAVLAIQMLPGHFQLAFVTQAGLAGMGLWTLVERPAGGKRAGRGVLASIIAGASAVLLAAAQLGPTWRLALLAESRRDFGYLSGFAASPIHLVSYFAPRLFQDSPLWRPVAWDPFHTSPEEHLAYVGLVPLFLALGAIRRGFRRDPSIRLLAWLAAWSLLLSLGPYLPGFASWCQLPGFSFFRASARWSLGTALALAILAGKGFDALADWPRPGRALLRFAALAVATPLLVIGAFELALFATDKPGLPAVADAFDRAARALPWSGDPPFREVMAAARRPQADVRVLAGLAREGIDPIPAGGLRLDRERLGIYGRELRGTALLVAALLALAPFARRIGATRAALLALTALDLWALGRHRAVDLAPIRPLTSQSPLLARLAREPGGSRVVGDLSNLPMVAGAAPVVAYRTLDLPALPMLARAALGPTGAPIPSAALHATGANLRLLNPYEAATVLDATAGTMEPIDDPALASWTFGAPFARTRIARSTYHLWRPAAPTSRAWLLPASDDPANTPLARLPALLQAARPLTWKAPDPEHLEVTLHAEGPAVVVVSMLFDPEWQGRWERRGEGREAELRRAFGVLRGGTVVDHGWIAATVPGPGDWTLRLSYRGQDVKVGLMVSASAWLFWLGIGWRIGRAKGEQR